MLSRIVLIRVLNVAFVTGACVGQVNYSYDAGGHLVQANYGAAGTVVYSYDAMGNMVSRSVASGANATITSATTASGGTDIAQNTFIVITGSNLVPATTPASGVIWSTAPSFASGQMPTQLSGVSVTVNSKPAYVYFFCSAATSLVCKSDQINVLTPLDTASGPVPVVVTNGSNVSAPFIANLKPATPTFLLFGATNYVAATHAKGGLIGPTSLYPGSSTPANPGEEIVVYAVGFGLPATALTQGSSIQSGALPTLPICAVGGQGASVLFAGLITPGLYQLNLTIPTAASSGDNAIRCSYGTSSTPPADLITVGQ